MKATPVPNTHTFDNAASPCGRYSDTYRRTHPRPCTSSRVLRLKLKMQPPSHDSGREHTYPPEGIKNKQVKPRAESTLLLSMLTESDERQEHQAWAKRSLRKAFRGGRNLGFLALPDAPIAWRVVSSDLQTGSPGSGSTEQLSLQDHWCPPSCS